MRFVIKGKPTYAKAAVLDGDHYNDDEHHRDHEGSKGKKYRG